MHSQILSCRTLYALHNNYMQLQHSLLILGLNNVVSNSVLCEEVFLASAGVVALLLFTELFCYTSLGCGALLRFSSLNGKAFYETIIFLNNGAFCYICWFIKWCIGLVCCWYLEWRGVFLIINSLNDVACYYVVSFLNGVVFTACVFRQGMWCFIMRIISCKACYLLVPLGLTLHSSVSEV